MNDKNFFNKIDEKKYEEDRLLIKSCKYKNMILASQFLDLAEKYLPRFCYMVDNYYKFPELLKFQIIGQSVLCSYEHYVVLYGEPNVDLVHQIKDNYPSFSLSFNKEWLPLVFDHFSKCTLVEKSVTTRKYNLFICMELNIEKFQNSKLDLPKLDVVDLDEKKHGKLLELGRTIKISKGLGGSGIIIDDELVAVGFIPHLVTNNRFSLCVFRDIWVNEKYRGKGYGKLITFHLCLKAIKQGVKRIFLWVEKDNLSAIKVYSKLGFETKDEVYALICSFNKEQI
ncbi:MAG: GNAT family N-acetyltransferase [Candidatus Heimdallarchaeaceae archaeon]